MLLRRSDRREINQLIRRTRAAANEIETLNSEFATQNADLSLARFRTDQGDRTPLVSLKEAARTLKTYAGFLQLVASTAKKEAAKNVPQSVEPAVVD
jgi:hypothetical protein